MRCNYKEASMRGKLLLSLFSILLISLALTAAPVQARGAECVATPPAGPAGTVFDFSCSGFDPLTILNVYVVEPDQRTVSAAVMTGYSSNTGSFITVDGSVKSDGSGNAN